MRRQNAHLFLPWGHFPCIVIRDQTQYFIYDTFTTLNTFGSRHAFIYKNNPFIYLTDSPIYIYSTESKIHTYIQIHIHNHTYRYMYIYIKLLYNMRFFSVG